LHLGILNPALFGTTHTCLSLALVVGHVSSHDVMGLEVQRSKVQSIRLEWKRGWLSGMEVDSDKSRILDGVLMGSGTKANSYELVSQIACISVSIFWY
jgi:hypothetical protein